MKRLINLKVGDIVVDKNGGERKVLDVVSTHKKFGLSYYDDFFTLDKYFTLTELQRDGCRRKISELDLVEFEGGLYKRTEFLKAIGNLKKLDVNKV